MVFDLIIYHLWVIVVVSIAIILFLTLFLQIGDHYTGFARGCDMVFFLLCVIVVAGVTLTLSVLIFGWSNFGGGLFISFREDHLLFQATDYSKNEWSYGESVCYRIPGLMKLDSDTTLIVYASERINEKGIYIYIIIYIHASYVILTIGSSIHLLIKNIYNYNYFNLYIYTTFPCLYLFS